MANSVQGLLPAYVDVSGIADSSNTANTELVQDASEIQTLLMNAQTKQVKELVRSSHWGVNHPVRRHVWQVICNQISMSGHEIYKEVSQDLFGEHFCPSSLPPFVDPAYCMRYHLNAEGRKSVQKILHVIHHLRPDITYCPMLYPLVSLFIHYMPEDATFSCAYTLLSEKQSYISQTQSNHVVSACVVMKLSKRFAKHAFLQFVKEVPDPENLQRIFQNWLSWVFKGLPFSYLVRVIDCFLLDKKKFLYRIVIALLILYNRHPGSAGNPAEGNVIQNLMDFCQNIPVPIDQLFKVSYGLRNFSEKLVNQLTLKCEISLRSSNIISERSQSAEKLPSSNSAFHLQLTSASLPVVKELRMSESSRARSLGIIPLGKFKSEIISAEQMSVLWSWLPLHITMNQPEVAYTTNKHGTSLIAFYMTVGCLEPTILLIKAKNDEVFGAYCSAKWDARKNTDSSGKQHIYFGTGETFLFTLVPEIKKYPWVGLCCDKDVPHSEKLFMAGDETMITVGAGHGQGLWLDQQLLMGRTEQCQTFRNDPLCSNKNFECKIVEVISFQ